MKKIFLSICLVLISVYCSAQTNIQNTQILQIINGSDTTKTYLPSFTGERTEITRMCKYLNVDNTELDSVKITLKSYKTSFAYGDYHVVLTLQKKSNKKVIYKHTFRGAYLWIMPDGAIYIGQPRFYRMVVRPQNNQWWGCIRDKEGVWETEKYNNFFPEKRTDI